MVHVLHMGINYTGEKVLTNNYLDRVFQKLPKCTSRRTRPGWVEPEVYFRIAHVAGDAHHDAPVAPYCEQTVEIALGLEGAFENGNIGALTRRVTADRIVNAVAPGRGDPKPPPNRRPTA